MKTVLFNGKNVAPSKIICVGRNYTEHIKELKNKNPEEVVLFIKPNSALSEELIKPEKPARYEGEISFIFEKDRISGVAFGIDITLTQEQNRLKSKGLPWEKAKAFDGSAVFSPFVPVERLSDLSMELYINGVLRQKGSVEEAIYSVEEVLTEIRKYFSIYDHDILMYGTPSGVGEIKKGDIFEGKILHRGEVVTEKRWCVK
ncbi:fumarylacetoacetate hydrolase family protein [Persephonella sp.]